MTASAPPVLPDLTVQLGRLSIPNPIMVASGTFGYANEMHFADAYAATNATTLG